jgi:hypothetical protein
MEVQRPTSANKMFLQCSPLIQLLNNIHNPDVLILINYLPHNIFAIVLTGNEVNKTVEVSGLPFNSQGHSSSGEVNKIVSPTQSVRKFRASKLRGVQVLHNASPQFSTYLLTRQRIYKCQVDLTYAKSEDK